jgi:hypothetical protein
LAINDSWIVVFELVNSSNKACDVLRIILFISFLSFTV